MHGTMPTTASIAAERRFEYGYFHTSGLVGGDGCRPAGTRVEVSRGPEYRVVEPHGAGGGRTSMTPLRVSLDRLVDDLEARGWYSGDLHVHMNYGGAYRNDPTRLAFQARAEDLHVVENLIVNKEGRVPDMGYFRPEPDPVSTPATLIVHGEEYHTSYWGHVGLLGLREHLVLPGLHRRTPTPPSRASSPPTRGCSTSRGRRAPSPATSIRSTCYPDPADTTRAAHPRAAGGCRPGQGGLLRGDGLRGRL